ncbi:heterokaryon incompatibility protein-domain-containing protein [Xylariaceae sp. FL1019]|nr:heterokaryon incompatibility protein-domain-containing protein [Xylariaceae sp. FL1019]
MTNKEDNSSDRDNNKWGISAVGLVSQAGIAAKKVWQDGTIARTPRELLTEYKTELYAYTPLPTPTCIRLLELAPGSPSELIQCKLRVVDLKHNPTYIALSYAWEKDESWTKFAASVAQGLLGDTLRHVGINRTESKPDEPASEGTKVMMCDGRRFIIKPNLYDALLQLRKHAPGSYWIDAVCMNQKDEREKTAQMQMMGSIYSNAQSVTVWLGECPQLLSPSAARLEAAEGNITQLDEEDKKRGKKRLIGDDSAAYVLVCAAYILSRRWFGRLWVLQEFCLARSLDIYFGGHHIRPETIVGLIQYFKNYYQHDGKNTGPSMNMFANMSRPFWGFHIKFVPSLLESRQLFQHGSKWSLEEWLYLVRGRSAKDSRDFVNAGLGLIRQQSLQIDQDLQLEASARALNNGPRLWSHLHATAGVDKFEVMLNLAACLLTQTQSLFLLSLASLGEDPLLPTWMLEPGTLPHRAVEPFAFNKDTHFGACEGGLDALARTLIADTPFDGDPAVGLIQYLDYTVFKARLRLKRLSKTNTSTSIQSYLGQKMTATDNAPKPDEAQALLKDLNDAWDKLKTIYSDKSWPDYGTTSKPETPQEYGAYFSTAVKINFMRTLFLTEEGRLGLGGCWIEEGEKPVVMVVESGYVPYIFTPASEKYMTQLKDVKKNLEESMQTQPQDGKRKQKTKMYQARLEFINSRPSPEAGAWVLDGEAYVHGFMHGEAMELGRGFEPIAIV